MAVFYFLFSQLPVLNQVFDKLSHSSVATIGTTHVVSYILNLAASIGRTSNYATLTHAAQVENVIANVGHIIARAVIFFHQRFHSVEFVVMTLMQLSDVQLASAVLYDARRSACNNSRHYAVSRQHLIDGIAILDIKCLEHFAVGTHIYLPVGESSINIHHQQLNFHDITVRIRALFC